MNILLKLFSKEKLWKEIINREGFITADEVEAKSIWSQVFNKTPELADYFKRREISLLKSVTLKENSPDFILGQIAENRLSQKFDMHKIAEPKVDIAKEVKKLPTVKSFLDGWNKKDADGSKGESQVKEGIRGGVQEGA